MIYLASDHRGMIRKEEVKKFLDHELKKEVVATLMVIIALMPTIRDVSQTKMDGAKPKLI
jgi:hypothetical protein